MKPKEIDKLAKKIWNYQELNQELKASDCLLVLGCPDTRLAERATQLYLEDWAPMILFSGRHGTFSSGGFDKPEAEIFADIAIEKGIPESKILVENKSTNTGENIEFSRKLLKEKDYDIDNLTVVTTPFSERRAYAAFEKQWPQVEVVVTSPQINFSNYPHQQLPKKEMINIMVGDLQRIKVYPKRDFQLPQEIPTDVWKAYKKLVEQGYTKYLIDEEL